MLVFTYSTVINGTKLREIRLTILRSISRGSTTLACGLLPYLVCLVQIERHPPGMSYVSAAGVNLEAPAFRWVRGGKK
ncbi:hypothetical protein BDV29DRAFT_174083 [Aspergillus leporis]|uniref:Uncharacterized protein n=1 Tax=Aspergillus leporis TaxID=41062 RepID=A0A5N5X458_9EURO|nr:hypothetical protein BDV29DRAFT_174083 [Aspergillus leporis]